LLSCHQNAGQNHDIKTGNGSFENVVQLRYLGIIFPVILYGCETSSRALREKHRLRVFENRVLRRTFGPKRDEVTGGWRGLHNEELHNLYFTPSIIRMLKSKRVGLAGRVAPMGEEECI
jgi:hypothetical protein